MRTRVLVLALFLLAATGLVGGGAGSGSAQVADADNGPRGVNVRLVAGAPIPPGARHVFGSWYNLPGTAQDKAVSLLGSAADAVEPDFVVSLPQPVVVAQQYQLALVRAQEAWTRSRGVGVVIAIIDTGVDCGHEDLAGRCVAGRDFTGTGSASDDNGHGTHVAGIAAAAGGNGRGGSGVAPDAKLLPVKVLDAGGSGQMSTIAAGMTWAAQSGAKVENLSLGCRCESQMMADAVAQARALGAVVIAAAGNDGTDAFASPARYAVGVAAIDAASHRAGFSNYGANAKVAAPGVDILSTCRGNQYCRMSGTSMAAPVAAGAAALLFAACSSCAPDQVERALIGGADAIATDKPIGGQLDVARSLDALGAPQPRPTASPTPGGQPPSATAEPGDFDDQLVALINERRSGAGLPPYRNDARLGAAAGNHNYTMAQNNCFAHQCAGEADPFQRMRSAGYPLLSGGENIGLGYQTPEDMVVGWMGSDGHRAAILGRYTDVGCAYLRGGQPWDTYWTCDFASGGSSGQPQPTVRPQPTATQAPLPQPTPWGAGYHMIIIADAGNKTLWDELYTRYCYPPRPGLRCTWPRVGEAITP